MTAPAKPKPSTNKAKKRRSKSRNDIFIQVVIVVVVVLGLFICALWFLVKGDETAGRRARDNSKRARPERETTTYDVPFVPLTGMDGILHGHLTLVDLSVPYGGLRSSENAAYDGVSATFCAIAWERQAQDPSRVPMFRDLRDASEKECGETMFRVKDLAQLMRKVREHDKQNTTSVTPTTAVAFHQTRCGSTLVANLLASLSETTIRSRVYSEAPMPIAALRACDRGSSSCDKQAHAALVQDVFYLLGRMPAKANSRDVVFFKIQSVGVHHIRAFTNALPNTPWMFVYRDGVEIMMSHFKPVLDSKAARRMQPRPVCLRNYRSSEQPPALVDWVETISGNKQISELTKEEFCAAHLAGLANSALQEFERQRERQNSPPPRWFLNYKDLPNAIWEVVLPRVLPSNLVVTPAMIQRLQHTAESYSKGRGSKAGQSWQEDSSKKQNAAPPLVLEAAEQYLAPMLKKLESLNRS